MCLWCGSNEWSYWLGSWTCSKCQPPHVYESLFEWMERIRLLRAQRPDLEGLNELPHTNSLARSRWSDIRRIANSGLIKNVRVDKQTFDTTPGVEVFDHKSEDAGPDYRRLDSETDVIPSGSIGINKDKERRIEVGRTDKEPTQWALKSSSLGEQSTLKKDRLAQLKARLVTMVQKTETKNG